MNGAASEERQKTVRVIPPKVDPILAKLRDEAKQLRTVAYTVTERKIDMGHQHHPFHSLK